MGRPERPDGPYDVYANQPYLAEAAPAIGAEVITMRLDLSGSDSFEISRDFQAKHMVRNQISPNALYHDNLYTLY